MLWNERSVYYSQNKLGKSFQLKFKCDCSVFFFSDKVYGHLYSKPCYVCIWTAVFFNGNSWSYFLAKLLSVRLSVCLNISTGCFLATLLSVCFPIARHGLLTLRARLFNFFFQTNPTVPQMIPSSHKQNLDSLTQNFTPKERKGLDGIIRFEYYPRMLKSIPFW